MPGSAVGPSAESTHSANQPGSSMAVHHGSPRKPSRAAIVLTMAIVGSVLAGALVVPFMLAEPDVTIPVYGYTPRGCVDSAELVAWQFFLENAGPAAGSAQVGFLAGNRTVQTQAYFIGADTTRQIITNLTIGGCASGNFGIRVVSVSKVWFA